MSVDAVFGPVPVASPQNPLPVAEGGTGQGTPAGALAALGGLVKVADTGIAGFTLQNATPVILTWNTPNDGNPHPFLVPHNVSVTSAETGGVITLTYTDPQGVAASAQLDAGAHGLGTFAGAVGVGIAAPGTVVTVAQTTALTLGAAKLFGSIWGA